jgi:serine-type D-Ala-D-Ala carboxypeptidase
MQYSRFVCIALALLIGPNWIAVGVVHAAEKPLPIVAPESLGLSPEGLAKIDGAVQEALNRGDAPGVVVVIVHKGAVVFRKAYGNRALSPEKLVMLPEIVFDMASLTKPIATATSIMVLLEQGKIKISDPIARHLPAFRRKETEKITVEQLLLHTSGFIADNPLKDYEAGVEKAWERLLALNPIAEPGSKFTYSDVNYILLAKIVEMLGGLPLDAFAHKHIFAPLGLNETTFKPQGKLKERAAPTERRNGAWMIGEVHDPRAYALGGVAGHAGLFSTAEDMAVYSQMLLNGGDYSGKRILNAETLKVMTTQRPVALDKGKGGLRAYGWDMQTGYSSNRGELFSAGESFGHTGFTGTSLWIDPKSQTAVIILSNRVHPDGKGNAVKLRSQVATLAAAAVMQPKLLWDTNPLVKLFETLRWCTTSDQQSMEPLPLQKWIPE